ncbi:metalloprotease, partial [Coemansia sp. RSA 988]
NLTTDLGRDSTMSNYFHLPKPNDFFPEDFSVPESTGPRPKLDKSVPTLLKYNAGLELWYRQDDKFYLPKGFINVEIKSPVINVSPRNRVIFDLLCACWYYTLTEELYSSTCAGLSYSISGCSTGLDINVVGFSQKLPLLIERVISNMRRLDIKESVFNDCLKKLQENFSSGRLASVLDQASSWGNQLLMYSNWHSTMLEKSLNEVTYEMLNSFAQMLFDQVRIKMLVTGNFTEQQAMDTASKVQKIINSQILSSCQMPSVRLAQLDPGYYVLPKTSLNKENTQSAVIANIQLGRANDICEWLSSAVFHYIFNTSFFDQLRTKEQLGYVVYSSMNSFANGNIQLILAVQSEYNPIYLSLRITEFLRTYRQSLIDLDEENLANIIKSESMSLQEQLKTITGEASRMWSAIDGGEYDFELISKQVECLETIGKQDIIKLWDTFVNPDTAPQYMRTDVHIWSTNTHQPSFEELEKHPASILALQRLVKHGTNHDINLEELDAFVKTASADGGQDNAFERLMTLYPASQEVVQDQSADDDDDDDDNNSSSESNSNNSNIANPKIQKIKTSLQMALASAVNAPDYCKHCSVDFGNIGMCQTCEGIWIIDDIARFQSTQRLNGLPTPITKLIPKYKD